jgi:hypothetical protein
MKTAIVTLAIGDAYLNHWRVHCESGWSRYAERHGFELIVIDKPLDQTFRAAARSPSSQKCLVLRPDIAGSFDRIIWIDSDVLINNGRAPSIAEGVPLRKIGATDQYLFPSRQLHRQFFMSLAQGAEAINPGLAKAAHLDPADWHAAWGLPRSDVRSIVQAGVMVLSPRHHRELLEHVYYIMKTAAAKCGTTRCGRCRSRYRSKACCTCWTAVSTLC